MRCSFFLCLTPNQLFGFSRKYVGIDDALLPNREWNQKQKHKKNSLGAMWNASHLAEGLCALRHWKRVSMPPTTPSLRHPLTRAFHIAPRIKTARRSRRKTPDDKMISWKEAASNLPKTILYGRDAIFRVRVK